MQIYIAAVYAPSEICLLLAAPTATDLERQLVAYIHRTAPQLLWPVDAEQVRRLCEQGQRSSAIAHFFSVVGDRWDQQSLYVQTLKLDAGHGGRASDREGCGKAPS